MTQPLNQPLFWHQGLFLQPHHFQYQDAWTAHNLARQWDLAMPWNWGFASLQIDETALATRQFVLKQLTLRWRDGTLTEYPGNARVESRRFDLSELSQGTRTIYIGLRRYLEDGPNVQKFEDLDCAAQADARLVVPADPQQVPDRYAQGPAGRVTLMTYVLRLFWEDELDNLNDYDLIPLARLELDGETVRLSPRCIPPCLSLAGSPALQQMLYDIRNEVIGRARQLEIFKQPVANRNDDAPFSPMLALSVLNRYGAAMTYAAESVQTHPWALYNLLRQLAAELSTFSEYCNLLGETRDGLALLPAYDHLDIGTVYPAVMELIRRLMNEITIGPEMLVHFERDSTSGNLFQVDIPTGFFGPRNRYYLMAHSTELDSAALNERLQLDAKLGGPDELDTLITRSLPGVDLMPLQALPLGMPRRAGAVYFRLESLSDAWENIVRDTRAALYVPNASADLRFDLIVIKG